MFVISIKPTFKKIFTTILSMFIVVFAIAILVDGGNTMAAGKRLNDVNSVSTNKERVTYIKKFGWIINEEACEIVDVKIPAEFNDVYEKYNKLQKSQGFNLEKYKGNLVKRYTYEVLNYKNETEFIRANLLIYNNTVIASDICSLKLDGFMHELNKKQSE